MTGQHIQCIMDLRYRNCTLKRYVVKHKLISMNSILLLLIGPDSCTSVLFTALYSEKSHENPVKEKKEPSEQKLSSV